MAAHLDSNGVRVNLIGDSCGIQRDGFGVEIQGHKHSPGWSGFCSVSLENETTYRIRLYNTNHFSAMVRLTLDEVNIGTFFLQPLSKYDIERPVDRPLAFMFSLTPSTQVTKSTIVATFQPETGSKTFEADVDFPHIDRTHRTEIFADMLLQDLFQLFQQVAGAWVLDPKCILMSWSNVEYDSPVHKAIHINRDLTSLKKSLPPLLKMSLLLVETLYITIEHTTTTELSLIMDSCPTVEELLENVAVNCEPCNRPLYLCSKAGRYLGNTAWIQGSTFVAELFNKNEIREMPAVNALAVLVRSDKPPHVFEIACRLSDDKKFFVEVDKDSTILQCRRQLQCLGGPESDRSMWVFCGELLDNSQTIQECGLKNNLCVEVILRKSKSLSSLEMKDPIAVEGLCHVDTSELIKKLDKKINERGKRKKFEKHQKLKRGHTSNTILGGRVKQRFIEVNAIEVDERFNSILSITLLPKELESMDLTPVLKTEGSTLATSSKFTCTIL